MPDENEIVPEVEAPAEEKVENIGPYAPPVPEAEAE